jgi:hypothetical protein
MKQWGRQVDYYLMGKNRVFWHSSEKIMDSTLVSIAHSVVMLGAGLIMTGMGLMGISIGIDMLRGRW